MVERDITNVAEQVRERLVERAVIQPRPIEPPQPSATVSGLTIPAAIDLYLRRKESDLGATTIESHRAKLAWFRQFCDREDLRTTTELTPRLVDQYHVIRRDDLNHAADGRLSTKTLADDMYLLRDFLRYLESVDEVGSDLHGAVHVPDLPTEPSHNDAMVDGDRAREIVAYLDRYHYASFAHVLWVLLCRTGARRSDLRALDVEDVATTGDRPYVEFRHRPKAAVPTGLKNGHASERRNSLPQSATDVIEDYVADQRESHEEPDGRRPLLTTTKGRASPSTIKKYAYMWTRPCEIGEECPHDRAVDDCTAAQENNQAFRCPSSEATHAVRTGYLTEHRGENIPPEILGDRADVSPEVLEEHYDMRTDDEKFEQRAHLFEQLRDSESTFLD